jgi:uncharacterized cupredoxin-like copper-binding protein
VLGTGKPDLESAHILRSARNVMRNALIAVALGLVLMLTAVSCSGGGAPSGGATINTTMSEMKYDPSTWTVKAGESVTISAKNGGTMVHDWIVRGMETQTKTEVQAGQTGSKTFTITTAGTYQVYCSQPGHEAAGMKGTLTVQ